MTRFLYNLLWPIGLLCFLPGYLLKMFRRGGYRRNFGQRFALYGGAVRRRLREQPAIWLHAVSVGEVAVALKLASAIKPLQPTGSGLVLTTTTTTGFVFAEKNALPGMEVMYTPLDFWPIIRRAFAAIRPRAIVLVEAEVWPNLVAEAHTRKIPIALVNARLSPRSERRFRRFRWLVAPTFRLLDLVCVQEKQDLARWSALGVRPDRIVHTGSIKYDPGDLEHGSPIQTTGPVSLSAFDPDRPLLFGGSTHRGEEETLARVFLRLRVEFPTLALFIAPRHTERAGEIRKKLENMSLRVSLASEMERATDPKPDCLLLDKTGELRTWYPIATVVFIGKSLTAHGGQNPVEPILAGKPVLFGPHMENFATLAQTLIANRAAIEVTDEASLENSVSRLLKDPAERAGLVENAKQIIASHRGATKRTAELVRQCSGGSVNHRS